MEEIRRKRPVLGEHQTGMNAHTHQLVVIVKWETTWKKLEENNQYLVNVKQV